MQVELVRVTTADGYLLDGALRKAPAGSPASDIDLVILHHGVGGNFYNPSFFETISDRLLALGVSVLRVNNRGHDFLYNPPSPPGTSFAVSTQRRISGGQLGAAAEIISDSLNDWRAWLQYAVDAGYRRICLWGHSLGAVKTIYFLAHEAPQNIAYAVASSPPRFSHSQYMASEVAADFQKNYDRAMELIAAGRQDDILSVTFPTAGRFTARTFVDKYGPDEQYDILKHLPKASVPLLVTLGGEEQSPVFRSLHAEVPRLVEGSPLLTFQVIDGADHWYTGKVDELWQLFSVWREKTAHAPA
jgi:pimeloyl-ACP methyl ester carboxylesterase